MLKLNIESKEQRMNKLFIITLMSLAMALRIPGIFHDFWFDEVWSFQLVHGLESPLEIFTRLINSNNHYLNSLLMYLIDKDNPVHWWKYRIFSLLCGTGTVLVGALLVRKVCKRNVAVVTTFLLLATSLPLVAYSSEARGYSSLTFFSILSLYSLLEFFKSKEKLMLIIFNLSVIFGFMSHLTFIYVFVGLLASSVAFLRKNEKKTILKELAKIFLIPLIVVYAMYIRYLIYFMFFPVLVIQSGGLNVSPIKTFSELPSYIVGYSKFGVVLGVSLWIAILTELIMLIKEKQIFGLFSSVVIVTALCHILLSYPDFSHFRFFICLFPFLIFLLCGFISRFYDSNKKYFIVVLITIIVISNVYYVFEFISSGKGKYLELIKYAEKNTTGEIITISSDDDFTTWKMITFYERFSNKKIKYVAYNDLDRRNPPDWFIVHDESDEHPISQSFEVFKGMFYKFEGYYPYSGKFSGFNWTLYKHP